MVLWYIHVLSAPKTQPNWINGRERKGTEGNGRERKGTEGNGREGKGTEGKGTEGKGTEGNGRERKGSHICTYPRLFTIFSV